MMGAMIAIKIADPLIIQDHTWVPYIVSPTITSTKKVE
jgi:hypothetical protein